MRNYSFEIDGETYNINEGQDAVLNGRRVTEWEVRQWRGEGCWMQYRNTFIPRNATEVQMREHIREYYAD